MIQPPPGLRRDELQPSPGASTELADLSAIASVTAETSVKADSPTYRAASRSWRKSNPTKLLSHSAVRQWHFRRCQGVGGKIVDAQAGL